MLVYNSLYLNLFSVNSFLTVLTLFILACFLTSTSGTNILVYSVLLLFLYTGVLLYNGAELFGILLFITELIVFFYIFCIYLNTNKFFLKKQSLLVFLIALVIYLAYIPTTSLDIFYKNWFDCIGTAVNDVSVIFLLFYHQSPITLILVGELLTVGTISVILLFSACFLKNSITIPSFTNKTQNTAPQVVKKSILFKNTRNSF